MSLVILYVATLAVFLSMDIVGLKLLVKPLFERHVGDLLRAEFDLTVAGLFYCFYVVGILYFVSVPAMRADSPIYTAARDGALLGLIAYGTYEATNMATLRGWTWSMTATDVIWGAFLTASAAACGVAIARFAGAGGS